MKKIVIFGILILTAVLILGCTGAKDTNEERIDNDLPSETETPGAIGTNCEMTFLREDKLAYGSMHVLYYDGYSIDCSCFNSNPELRYLKSDFSTRYFAHFFVDEINNPDYIIDEITSADSISTNTKHCAFGKRAGENPDYLYCEPFQISMRTIVEDDKTRAKDELIIESIYSIDKTQELPNTDGEYLVVEGAELVSQTCTIWKAK